MKTLAEQNKDNQYWQSGYGTGPESIARREIYGIGYIVTVFKDFSVMGTNGREVIIINSNEYDYNYHTNQIAKQLREEA